MLTRALAHEEGHGGGGHLVNPPVEDAVPGLAVLRPVPTQLTYHYISLLYFRRMNRHRYHRTRALAHEEGHGGGGHLVDSPIEDALPGLSVLRLVSQPAVLGRNGTLLHRQQQHLRQ
jgi:hypothetical protein